MDNIIEGGESMSPEEFLSALQDIIQRAETEEGYMEYLIDDVKDLIEETKQRRC